jgi:diguanylate cyclase
MAPIIDTPLVLMNGLGIMALTALAFGAIERTALPSTARSLLQGLAFGIGAFVAMLSPAQVTEGVFVDARGIFVGLSGAFCGPPGALIAMLLAGSARAYIGGAGAMAGVCGILLAGLAGLFWRRIYWEAGEHSNRALLVLGLMMPSSLIAFLLLPEGLGTAILQKSGPALVSASVIAALALGAFIRREIRLVGHERTLKWQATTDSLTGLLNRRSFEARVMTSLEAFPSSGAMLIVDVDHFKAVNDQHGHEAGDLALRRVARILNESVRQNDVVGRIGGEEFAVFLQGVSLHQARDVASRIRQLVEEPADHIPLTVSVGLNWLPEPADYDTYYSAADAALYAAKNSGRNRVIFSSMSRPSSIAARAVV